MEKWRIIGFIGLVWLLVVNGPIACQFLTNYLHN